MAKQLLIRFVCGALIISIAVGSVVTDLTGDFSPKNDTPVSCAYFDAGQTYPVCYGLPSQQTQDISRVLCQGLPTVIEKSLLDAASHTDRLYRSGCSTCRFLTADDLTLFALNCMLTV
jgi:hypothetical protein